MHRQVVRKVGRKKHNNKNERTSLATDRIAATTTFRARTFANA